MPDENYCEHPLIKADDELCGKLLQLAVAMVAERTERTMWLQHGWPHCAICFAHEDENIRDDTMLRLSRDHDNSKYLQENKDELGVWFEEMGGVEPEFQRTSASPWLGSHLAPII